MAEQHRGLAAALNSTPAMIDFVQGGSRRHSDHRQSKASEEAAIEPQDESLQAPTARKPRHRRTRKPAVQRDAPSPTSRAKVAITTRFRQGTADALRRASLERKLRGETLHSQQDIIEQAVQAWLTGNERRRRHSDVSSET